jgi:DNA ligase-1
MISTTLFNKDVKTNNIRFWRINHIIIKKQNIPKIEKIIINNDWSIDDVLKLTSPDPNGIGLYWYENGIDTFENDVSKLGKIAVSAGNLVLTGKNIGKKNETTPAQQTLMIIESDIKKKRDKGYTDERVQSTVGYLYHPMAIHKYQDYSDKIDLTQCCVQPKLDGVRVLITLHEGEVVIYSRQLNPFIGFDELAKLLRPLLRPGLYLDGELFKPGIKFETLVGIAKNENLKTLDDMQIYLFDSFTTSGDKIIEEPFSVRFDRLRAVEPYIKVVKCEPINNKPIDELLDIYSKDFEGLVIRHKDGLYETSLNKEIRTEKVLKYKKFFDSEFKIVGFEHGKKGKELNAIKYILETPEGLQFSAVPNQTLEERRELYKLYSENPKEFEKIKGKFATIKYQELTKNNIPRFGKFIAIRND